MEFCLFLPQSKISYLRDSTKFCRYCQAQSQLHLSWSELALFSLWRTYAAQPTAYAVQPTAYAPQPTAYAVQPTAYAAQPGAYAAQPKLICESLFCHCPTSIFSCIKKPLKVDT